MSSKKSTNRSVLFCLRQDAAPRPEFEFESAVMKFCSNQDKPLPYGLVVRIPGFHPGGPGSIPGVGRYSSFAVYTGVYIFSFWRLREREKSEKKVGE